jgi:hypothetical protein
MKYRNTLLVRRASPYELLSSSQGIPIWPVSEPLDLERLEKIVSVFGSRIDLYDGKFTSYTPDTSEVVTALGQEVFPQARLYAHLTQRQLRVVKNVDKLDPSKLETAVVVSLAYRVTSRFLDKLYADCGDLATGLIFAETPNQLRDQVLVRAAAASLSGSLITRRIDLHAFSAVGKMADKDRIVLGNLSSTDDIEASLQCNSGVLSILSHSDGMDAYLGQNRILCAVMGGSFDGNSERSNRCQQSSYCHRLKKSLEEVSADPQLVKSDLISARIFLWMVCWGLLPYKGWLNPSSGRTPTV